MESRTPKIRDYSGSSSSDLRIAAGVAQKTLDINTLAV